MTQLSKSFTLQELVFSQTAAREGIENTPSPAQIRALRELCTKILQPLRDAVAMPIVVSSGYRSPRLRRALRETIAPRGAETVGRSHSSRNVRLSK